MLQTSMVAPAGSLAIASGVRFTTVTSGGVLSASGHAPAGTNNSTQEFGSPMRPAKPFCVAAATPAESESVSLKSPVEEPPTRAGHSTGAGVVVAVDAAVVVEV